MDVLIKRGYESFLRIDEGGQANVYRSSKDGRTVAIKVIKVSTPDKKLDDDIKRELQIVKNARHPNCMRVYDLFRTKSKVYIIMEFMPNGNIGDLVRKKGPLCEWNAKVWFCPVARAVKYLHNHKIAHRDLKLDNVLLDAYMNPIVSDFGFSRFVAEDESGAVIKSETYCGTLSYNPPEILRQIPYNPYKGDIWCLGVLLFIMINQKYPFDKSDRIRMFENQMSKNYHLEKEIEDNTTLELKNLIEICLEPIPERRPSIEDVCLHPWFPIVLRETEILASGGRTDEINPTHRQMEKVYYSSFHRNTFKKRQPKSSLPPIKVSPIDLVKSNTSLPRMEKYNPNQNFTIKTPKIYKKSKYTY